MPGPVAVMAHIGIRPQSIGKIGRFKAEATTAEIAAELVSLAEQMVDSGAGSLLRHPTKNRGQRTENRRQTLTSIFHLLTSDFCLLTSDFCLCRKASCGLTSDFCHNSFMSSTR